MTKMPTGLESPNSPSRRNFLAAVGATVASINTAACIRKPYERILPFGRRPEDLVPGEPQYFSTAINFGGSVQGLLAKSTDGRPTKVEGNPKHPQSLGATNAWAQASVLELYDPDRSRTPFVDGEAATMEEAIEALTAFASTAKGDGGKSLAVVIDETPSPSLERLLGRMMEAFPGATLYGSDGAGDTHARAGAALVGLSDLTWTSAGQPRIIATFDADPMSTEGDTASFTRAFARGRDPSLPDDQLNRLYAAESSLTVTGSNADHRLPYRSARIGDLLAAVAAHLGKKGFEVPAIQASAEAMAEPWAQALAADLASRPRGTTLVMVGERQAPQVHALGLLINQALGNFGSTVTFTERTWRPRASLGALAKAIADGEASQVLVLGANPVYAAAGDVPLAEALEKADSSVHLGLRRDETGGVAKCHIPMSHYLEAWGDLVSRDGTVSVQQPLVAPLHDSMSSLEALARMLGEDGPSGYDIVRATLEPMAGADFETTWQTWLHDGVAARMPSKTPRADARALSTTWTRAADEDGFELDFVRDNAVLDGRFGNSPWLQELPDPLTKLTWDNAAIVSPATAKKLRVENETVIRITHHGVTLDMPVWIQAGTADGVIVLPLGYGQKAGGRFAAGGFDVSKLRLDAAPWILTGAKVAKTYRSYTLACAQVEESLHGRSHVRTTTQTDFTEDQNFVEKFEVMPAEEVKTFLWDEPFGPVDHMWGMTIDLNQCTGCGTCTVACQAENNIPWVGKAEVLKGREMHWIRVDRYFEAEDEPLQVKYQPMNCQQCETAPCENVCPVAATVHSPEGMNDMVYNRCIGTRYCANNCPYKVRRFNFFHYAYRNDQDYGLGIAMQRNPDVTVRYRGVMEKCSYCVQRVQRARIEAKVHRNSRVVEDGEIVTACQQACPGDAIRFGNLKDEDAMVTKKANDPRNYAVVAELNTRPRTTYLAKLTNPNPKLTNG